MLITLVIIGVIAALTIPNLLQKYQEQTTVKKVQKFYANLSNAYNLAMKDNGPATEWNITGINEASTIIIYNILFKPYFKIAKNCGPANEGNCIVNKPYKKLNNDSANNYGSNHGYYTLTLDDGAAVCFKGDSNPSLQSAAIFYDVNGHKEPNQWGKDLFSFALRNDKVFPAGMESGAYSIVPFSSHCKRTSFGDGCAAWVIYKGNMDYLHCDDLSWTGKDKCSK